MIWGIESDRLPHQLQVAFLLHPASPAQRVLVAHATGSGKTYEQYCTVLNTPSQQCFSGFPVGALRTRVKGLSLWLQHMPKTI